VTGSGDGAQGHPAVVTPTERPRTPALELELERERRGWYELVGLIRELTLEERLEPGYAHDWAVRDVVAHLGTWLTLAEVQLERMHAGSYEGHDVDADELDASFHAALRDQPWEVAWVVLNAGRTRMLDACFALGEEGEEPAWWIRTSGGDHYDEHLARLRDWAAELVGRRSTLP
jgi:hypothetical protein